MTTQYPEEKILRAAARRVLYISQPLVAVLAGLEKIWDVVPSDVEPKLAASWFVVTGALGVLAAVNTRD